jgi:hypothetical protein
MPAGQADWRIANGGDLDVFRTNLYPARPGDTTKALKMKRNNLNHYACRRINKFARIRAAPEIEY